MEFHERHVTFTLSRTRDTQDPPFPPFLFPFIMGRLRRVGRGLIQPVWFNFLNGSDIEQLELTDIEILDAVEDGLRARGLGKTVVEPRVHLLPDPAFNGHFNVLRGYVAPLALAGVKIVGDYVGNYEQGLPSEMALLNLFDPRTGMPVAVVDATALTEMHTGAPSALGARHLARPDAKVLGHIGALRAHVDSGRLDKTSPHGELGEIVAGLKPGRESADETNLFWHRGLSLSGIAPGAAMLRKAEERGLGQKLRFS